VGKNKIKIVVIDDSALMRRLLAEIIERTDDLEVVGVASDPYAARELIRKTNPDVITLDIEMPRMDGLDFLEKLMRLRPTPVVMISTLTQQGSEAAVRALQLGAVDVFPKPKLDIERSMGQYADELCQKLRDAARTKPRQLIQPVAPALSTDSVLEKRAKPALSTTEKLIAIGSSTGGTEALKTVLTAMPADSPAILVTQHMPEAFTRSFANRLDGLCRISVKEAEHGERVLPGHAYIAPGHSHLLLAHSGANYTVELSQGPPVNRHRPSVDVLFRSVANIAGANALGVILTGMGKDGAHGMRELHDLGCWTIAQDEASCVVFGMPKEAIALGGVSEVLPLDRIGPALVARLGKLGHASRV
jgi:two-component system chemotaxis response regulator CheB